MKRWSGLIIAALVWFTIVDTASAQGIMSLCNRTLTIDGAGNARYNCPDVTTTNPLPVTLGGAGGSVTVVGTASNAGSNATSSTNVPNVSYNYWWNNTNWIQAQGDATNGAFVQVKLWPSGSQTTSGALKPVTAASGKVTETAVTVTAATSITLAAANTNRISIEIQCDGTAIVGISKNGATLTSATGTNVSTVIPTGSYPLYIPPIASLAAYTGYTATTQTCRVTEYNQ